MSKIAYVGDSLGQGTAPHVPGAKADVKVGRSSADGVKALPRLLHGTTKVVLDLGTNDGSAGQLVQSVHRAIAMSGGRQIFVPIVHGPGAAQKNAALRRTAGITVVDWNAPLADGIHPNGPAAYAKRAHAIKHAIGGLGPRPTPATYGRSTPSPAPSSDRTSAVLDYFQGNRGQPSALLALKAALG